MVRCDHVNRVNPSGTTEKYPTEVISRFLAHAIFRRDPSGTHYIIYTDVKAMKIGYIRVSTQEQNTIRQEVLMAQLGVEQVFIDRMSGKNTQRPELKAMLEFVRRGDVVIVESISRFARNTRDLLELVEQVTAKGVEFVSQKESIDTSTPTGKFMLTIFGAVAELEREYILQRQREGIAIAKANGVYKGRKPVERPEFPEVVSRWQKGEMTAVEAMKKLNMASSTFYRKVRRLRHDSTAD